jgi:ribosomal protein L11 methyltransferase
VIVVVAADEAELPRVRARLRTSGVLTVRVEAPSKHRRLLLADLPDERDAEHLALALRAEKMSAVARPARGPRLDAWMRHTAPIRFGDELSVCFAWSEHDRRGLANVIELGGGGFGNGEHPSTRMLLEALIARIRGGERVLDVGCGSGVLGLAALRLGASRAVATDIDPAAVDAAGRNAALNGMSGSLDATIAPLSDLAGPFDVVVANVGRAALVELAPDLVRLVAPDGWLGVSGMSAAQGAQVAEFLRPLVACDHRLSGEWSAVLLTRVGRETLSADAVV